MDFSDEDEEEDETKTKHAQIVDSNKSSSGKPAGSDSKISRKGTGFVAMGDMDFSDEEDEEEESPPPQPKAKAKTGPKFAVDNDDDKPAKKDDGKKHAGFSSDTAQGDGDKQAGGGKL